MPFVNTSPLRFMGGEGGRTVGDALFGLGSATLAAFGRESQTGVPVPTVSAQAPSGGGFDVPFVDVVPQGTTCIRPQTSTTTRLPSRVHVPKLDARGNLRVVTFMNMGTPQLWSGDKKAAKRWNKCHPRRSSGGRRRGRR